MSETAETFTCARCGETYDKIWSDEEAAAEAEGNFPGIDVTDPDEAGVVCTDCYEYLMGRARAEAPELIGPGWRGEPPSDDPIGDALRADAEEARGEPWPSRATRCYSLLSGAMVHVKPDCRCRP